MSQIKSENRTKNYIKQIKISLFFRALAVLASFFSVPLIIKYLGVERYGVWSTLSSMVSWLVLFDGGIGNGLRNKVSESLANEDRKEAQSYISTAYVVVAAISFVLMLIFFVVSEYTPWSDVFNVVRVGSQELKFAVNVTAIFLIVNFWLSLVNQVFHGLQKTSMVVFNQFLSNSVLVLALLILFYFFEPSLVSLSFFHGASLLSSTLILSFWFFRKNKQFIPMTSFFDVKKMKSLTTIGLQFFIIQIAVVVIFSTDKMLITQFFGPEYVASYDVVFKLFSVISLAHGVLIAPLWSAYGDAYYRNDMDWIKKTIKKQFKIYVFVILVTMMLAFLSKPIIKLWIGMDFEVDNILILAMTIFILVSTWSNMAGCFLGGIGYVRLGSCYTVATAVMNVPLSYFYSISLNYGVSGVVFGTITSVAVSAVISPIQVYYFVFSKNKNELCDRILR